MSDIIKEQVNLTLGNKIIGTVCYWNDCECLHIKYNITDFSSYGLVQTSLNISSSLGKLCQEGKLCRKPNCCGSYAKIHNSNNCGNNCGNKCCSSSSSSCKKNKSSSSLSSISSFSSKNSKDSSSSVCSKNSKDSSSSFCSKDSSSSASSCNKECCRREQKPIEFINSHDNISCYEYKIPNKWCKGTKLYIIAKAKVTDLTNKQTLALTSQIGDNVRGPISSDPYASSTNPFVGVKWGPVKSAVQARNWYANPANPILPGLSIGPISNRWGYNNRSPPDVPNAIWISTAQNTEQWWIQTWRRFTKTFNLCNGYPIAGTITINADDQYNLYINNIFIVTYANIFGPLQTYTFKPKIGQNILDIVTKNIASGVEGNLADQILNPNGLTYNLNVDYYPLKEAIAAGVKVSCGKSCPRSYFTITIC